MRKIASLLLFLFLISAGCAPLISRELRKELSPDITFKQVIKDPDAHKEKTIFISGIILGSRNTKEGTLIEILQKPADIGGRPKNVDDSDGRFLALYDGYLDTAIYSSGRDVAVAGKITGKRILPLGEIDYIYPLISIKKVHLFKVRKEEGLRYHPYPYWWWYHPRWHHP